MLLSLSYARYITLGDKPLLLLFPRFAREPPVCLLRTRSPIRFPISLFFPSVFATVQLFDIKSDSRLSSNSPTSRFTVKVRVQMEVEFPRDYPYRSGPLFLLHRDGLPGKTRATVDKRTVADRKLEPGKISLRITNREVKLRRAICPRAPGTLLFECHFI